MQNRNAAEWLAQGRALVLRGDAEAALAWFAEACSEHPASADLALAHAGLLWQSGQAPSAEQIVRALLEREPGHLGAAFLLAKMLREQARMGGVESVLRNAFEQGTPDVASVIQAIELLDDCGRKQAAFDLVEAAIARGSRDARLHAYAGMLGMQVGEFERARERYAYALAHDARALDWQSAYGYAVSKRYERADDPDFTLFDEFLQRTPLADTARASVLFARGKARDDIGEYAHAASDLREANRLIAAGVDWSRKNWRRIVSARLDAKAPVASVASVDEDFRPVFIVGMPRSGTTLVAERLARYEGVCNRGELGWIAHLAEGLARAAKPADAITRAAATYRMQVRQDDTEAQWFIDKQPLNFLHVDFMLAMFPRARIVRCRRNARDTALSIWMQHFAGREQDFAYDFENIAAVVQAEERLFERALRRHPSAIREVRYEAFVADPEAETRALAEWVGLRVRLGGEVDTARVISTASAWQARQPVHTRSIGRWRAYAPHLPELLQFPDD
jgi:tetratricopeptide (TPR) repeat protein